MKIQILENTKNISKKNKLIQKYDLKYIGKCKEYFILNTSIISNNTYLEFYKIVNSNDKEYKLIKMFPFSFYDVEKEYIYDKYMNDNYILKCYDNHLILELIDK
tara:strand:- start:2948 stop:3259 length:312 start_codon:yes stop_codon:yes gene_type:complete